MELNRDFQRRKDFLSLTPEDERALRGLHSLLGDQTPGFVESFYEALLHKPEASRDNPSPRRSYATAGTGTVAGRPSCVKRLSKATRTCSSVTWRSNVRAITRSPKRLKQCILVSTRLLR